MLKLRDVEAGYGRKQVLFGVSLRVDEGEIVGLIGPNGSGKSTVLRTVCGLLRPWAGEIRFEGTSIGGSQPARNVARGITFAPQGSRVFDGMTVHENLLMGGMRLPRGELAERIEVSLALFPHLRDRLRQDAGRLSGGEQQMVAIARALVARPKILLLDEPSLGLSPGLVRDVLDTVVRVNTELGTAVLLVEQKVREALRVCRRVYSLKLGRVLFDGSPEELQSDPEGLRKLFL